MPLSHKRQTAYTVLRDNGRTRNGLNCVTARLIAERDTEGRVVPIIGTYIYDNNYRDNYGGELDTLAYRFDGSNFTGYFITSRLDGKMLAGRRIVKGKEEFIFFLNERAQAEGSCAASVAADEDELHLYIGLKMPKVSVRSLSVLQTESDWDEKCSICRLHVDDCTCISIIICRFCQKRKSQCQCAICSVCEERIVGGSCLCCPRCKRHPCECDNSGGSNTGTSGTVGGGGQGGSSGSGGTSGNTGGGGNGSGNKGNSDNQDPEVNQATQANAGYWLKPALMTAKAQTTIDYASSG